ncbi:MAG: FecR domain-containing protein [Leeuwenhoekiella sp.]
METKLNQEESDLAKWLSGNLKGPALTKFESSENFELYKNIAVKSSLLRVPETNVDEALKRQKAFNKRLKKRPSQSSWHRYKYLWTGIAAAAVIAILLTTGLFQKDTFTIQADYGQTLTHTLPDQSIVILNAGSSISYMEKSFLKKRTVTLVGEGFFEVQKGSDFIVRSTSGSVQVLGTSFNVYDRGGTYTVHCNTGKVRVQSGDGAAILEPGMYAFAKAGTLQSKMAMPQEIPMWRSGKNSYIKTALSEVFDAIERQFAVKIVRDDVDTKRTFTGFFTHDSLKKALYQVGSPMDISYTVKDDVITLK